MTNYVCESINPKHGLIIVSIIASIPMIIMAIIELVGLLAFSTNLMINPQFIHIWRLTAIPSAIVTIPSFIVYVGDIIFSLVAAIICKRKVK